MKRTHPNRRLAYSLAKTVEVVCIVYISYVSIPMLMDDRIFVNDNVRRVWKYQRGNQNTQIDLQNTTQKTKWSRNTNITKTGGGLRCSGSVSSSCSTSDTRRVTVKQHEHHMTWKSCWTPVYIDKYNNNKNISGIRVTLVLYVCFVDRCLSFCTFSFGHFVVCSSIYRFWLPPFGIF